MSRSLAAVQPGPAGGHGARGVPLTGAATREEPGLVGVEEGRGEGALADLIWIHHEGGGIKRPIPMVELLRAPWEDGAGESTMSLFPLAGHHSNRRPWSFAGVARALPPVPATLTPLLPGAPPPPRGPSPPPEALAAAA